MQRAIDVQLHYVVDHPKGESVIQKNLPFHNTFRDKRHLIILVAVTQLLNELQSATSLTYLEEIAYIQYF